MSNPSPDAEQNGKPAQIARTGKVRAPRRMGKDLYEHACRVYFIEAVGMGLVKIGYTVDPVKRFMSMLTMSPAPLSLLGSMWGGPQKERALHEQLEAHWVHGEWFEKCPEVMAIVATCETAYGDDLLNQVARVRGAKLMEYLEKLRRGEVVRPTRGKNRRPRSLNPRNLPYEASNSKDHPHG